MVVPLTPSRGSCAWQSWSLQHRQAHVSDVQCAWPLRADSTRLDAVQHGWKSYSTKRRELHMLSQFYIARSKSARARGHATAAPSYDCRRPARAAAATTGHRTARRLVRAHKLRCRVSGDTTSADAGCERDEKTPRLLRRRLRGGDRGAWINMHTHAHVAHKRTERARTTSRTHKHVRHAPPRRRLRVQTR